jgi:CheY-like chemotaxis protein
MKSRISRVLVVDDYDNMRKAAVGILESLGLEVTEAIHGMDALRKLRESTFDAVFTDIVMPEMDGFELCEEIRKSDAWKDLPVIVTSTHCDAGYVVRALRLGADEYVPKPVNRELVARVLERLCADLSQEVAS